MLKKILEIIFNLIAYSFTGIDAVDEFMYYSSTALIYLAAVVLILFVFLNQKIRVHKRPEDRFIFRACVLTLMLLVVENMQTYAWRLLEGNLFLVFICVAPAAEDFLYMMTILQWLMFVDYSLYRSEEHIRRRYKHAVIPIVIYTGVIVAQSVWINGPFPISDALIRLLDVSQIILLVIEGCYIASAIYLVIRHDKETREPKFFFFFFFIIPCVLGTLIRDYDAAMMTLGILLTYIAVVKRDRYLDHDTQFFNRAFLDFLSGYRDRKKYSGGNGILIRAQGHKEDMAELLRELKPAGSNVFYLGEDRFLLLSEAIRGSAAAMAVMTITEAAETSKDPYTPEIVSIRRSGSESADAFAERLMKESMASGAFPGGAAI